MSDNEKMVTEILETKPISRTDDFILYGFVLKKCGVSLDMTLREFFSTHKKLKVPSFKSIERTRRLIQSVRLDLIDCDTYKIRENEEEKYRQKFKKGI